MTAKKPLLELLKDLSAIIVGAAAVLYIFGYIVHLAYFRVLGVEAVGQPLDYVRLAADYSASIISSLPQLLFAARYYLPKLFQPPLLMETFCCFVIILLLLLLYLPIRKIRSVFDKQRTSRRINPRLVLWGILNITIVVCLIVLMRMEFDIAKVRDVLQTVDSADIQQMQKQVAMAEGSKWENAAQLDLRIKYVSNAYDKYADTHKGSPGFRYWNLWFNPKGRPDHDDERRANYLTLLLINLIVLVAIVFQLRSLKMPLVVNGSSNTAQKSLSDSWQGIIIFVLVVGLCVQAILFPFMYATLGRYYVYPVVRLRLADQSDREGSKVLEQVPTIKNDGMQEPASAANPSWTHGVYLIAQSDSEIVVYDRLNFFQIKHVPRTQILGVSQVFSASPFESCSKQEDELTPCEILWMPEDNTVIDF